MSDPQLRCLLCDLILADESAKGQATERCRQCGRDILAGQTQPATVGDEPLTLQPLGRAEHPPPLPPPPPPVSAALEDDLPVASVVPKSPAPAEVPTFGPRPRPSAPPGLPPLGKKPVPKAPLPPPPRKTSLPDPERPRTAPPRPQMITALGVLGCMTVLIILCLAVIAYAILFGLQKARKAGKAEAPAAVARV